MADEVDATAVPVTSTLAESEEEYLASPLEVPRAKRAQGQWEMGYREPLTPQEQNKRNQAGLDVYTENRLCGVHADADSDYGRICKKCRLIGLLNSGHCVEFGTRENVGERASTPHDRQQARKHDRYFALHGHVVSEQPANTLSG